MKILVTAGGTKEYIDGVRYIGNSSSGQTGADLVDYLVSLGHEVSWLGAKCGVKPTVDTQLLTYETFDELMTAMKSTLANHSYDAVFQAAAVSDFKVESVLLDGEQFVAGREVKLPTADEVQLQLTKNPKLVSEIKSWSSNPSVTVIAFKLTNSNDSEVRRHAIQKLLNQDAIDMVAHNDLNEFTADSHGFNLYGHLDHPVACEDIRKLADEVMVRLEQ
ncbi:MAG: phosphopantothenoylcysteine decarboxylase domain-containing protein [Marinicella sp.]